MVGGGAGGAEPLWRRTAGDVEGRADPHPRSPAAAEPAEVVRDGCQAMITPPPSLLSRQDQGQIQALSNQLQQLSQQSRSVSQSSQQLSQSLQQATQRLSQTEQQLASARQQQNAAESASRSMSQASAEASRRVDETRASADRAISEMMRSASQSASRALSENMASVTSSMGASFSSALRLASQSAVDAMRSAASVAQQAQADATALRVGSQTAPKTININYGQLTRPQKEANTQIQQAQGAALSVTQTALAVVGGIIGSSLLTGVGFVLVLRHRRKKRRQLRRGDGSQGIIGYPNLTGTSNKAYSVSSSKKSYAASDDASSTYSTDNNGFKFPSSFGNVKQPAAAAAPATSNSTGVPRKTLVPGVGYAVSFYGRRPSTTSAAVSQPPPFQLGNPPPPRAATAAAAAAASGKFSLFPKQPVADVGSQATSASSAGGAGVGPSQDDRGQGMRQQRTGRSSNGSFPSLDRWLRDGTDVSPFSTLRGQAPENGAKR